MKNKLRRYEVLLPARFNDGREVPGEVLGEAVKEIVNQFGALSYYESAAHGYWQHEDTLYRDDLGLLVVDVPDTATNRKWMKSFKARWKAQLGQIEIWMVSYRIAKKNSLRLNGDAERPSLNVDEANPWVEYTAMFKDDPYFDEWQQAIAENRSKIDEDSNIP